MLTRKNPSDRELAMFPCYGCGIDVEPNDDHYCETCRNYFITA